MMDIVADIYSRYLKLGEFLKKWKQAKLVLIPKVSAVDQEILKAGPICLIDDIGKRFERIIVKGDNDWMEDKEGLISANQYRFKKGK